MESNKVWKICENNILTINIPNSNPHTRIIQLPIKNDYSHQINNNIVTVSKSGQCVYTNLKTGNMSKILELGYTIKQISSIDDKLVWISNSGNLYFGDIYNTNNQFSTYQDIDNKQYPLTATSFGIIANKYLIIGEISKLFLIITYENNIFHFESMFILTVSANEDLNSNNVWYSFYKEYLIGGTFTGQYIHVPIEDRHRNMNHQSLVDELFGADTYLLPNPIKSDKKSSCIIGNGSVLFTFE